MTALRAPGRYDVLRPAMMMTSGRLLAFAAAFFIPVVLARVFTVAEFGTYKQLFLLYGALYCAAQVGIATSLYYFAPRAPRDAGHFAANSLLTLAAAGGVCALLLVAGRDTIATLMSNAPLAAHAPALGLYLLLMLIAAPFEIVLVARRRYAHATWAYAVSDLVRAALLILPAALTRDLRWLLAGAVAAALLRVAAMLLVLRREFGSGLTPRWPLYRQQLAYSVPFALAVLVETAQSQYHQFYVAHTFDAATFAIYAVGCLQIPLVEFVASPICDVMMVRMAESLPRRDDGGAGNEAAARSEWHGAARSLALLFFPLFALLALLAPEIITLLFTDAYRASAPIFVLWSASILMATFLVDGVLRVYAQTRFILWMNLGQLIVVAALIGPLVGLWGLRGAVAATLLALVAAKLAGLERIRRVQGVALGRLLPWRDLGALAAAAAVAALPARLVESFLSAPLPRLTAATVVYAATYWLLARRWAEAPALAAPIARKLRSLWPREAATEVHLG